MIILLILLLLWFIADPASAGIVLGIAIIAGIISALVDSQNSKEAQEAEEKKRQQRAEEKKRAEDAVQRSIGQLTEKYGRLSNTIRLEKWRDMPDIKKCLLVFGESELLYVDGREVLFKDIISYSITDDYRIKHGEVEYTSETNTSTGSLLGRSAAGAVLGGGVGAVIGASSASKNTTTIGTQKDDTIIHNYSLSINVRSLENPLGISTDNPNWFDKANMFFVNYFDNGYLDRIVGGKGRQGAGYKSPILNPRIGGKPVVDIFPG